MYWTPESWGWSDAPEAVDEVVARANEVIAEYAKTFDDLEVEGWLVEEFSSALWEAYCQSGDIEDAILIVTKRFHFVKPDK